MGKKTKPEETEKAIELRLSGMTLEDIAEELNRSTQWVHRQTKHLHLDSKCKTRRMTKCKVVAESNKLIKWQGKKLKVISFLPVVFGGLNTI